MARCEVCGCKVIGHGVQDEESIFCGASCAQRAGVTGLRDRARSERDSKHGMNP
jgi:hypothetical protein